MKGDLLIVFPTERFEKYLQENKVKYEIVMSAVRGLKAKVEFSVLEAFYNKFRLPMGVAVKFNNKFV